MLQPMRTRTSFKGDVYALSGSLLEERDQPRSGELSAQHNIAVAAEPDNVKAVLVGVDLLDLHSMSPSYWTTKRIRRGGGEPSHKTKPGLVRKQRSQGDGRAREPGLRRRRISGRNQYVSSEPNARIGVREPV